MGILIGKPDHFKITVIHMESSTCFWTEEVSVSSKSTRRIFKFGVENVCISGAGSDANILLDLN